MKNITNRTQNIRALLSRAEQETDIEKVKSYFPYIKQYLIEIETSANTITEILKIFGKNGE